MKIEQRKLWWLHFARFCTGKYPLNKRTVETYTQQTGGFSPYDIVAKAASLIASSDTKDFSILMDACKKANLGPQLTSAIVNNFENGIKGKGIVVHPNSMINNYPLSLTHFRVPIKYYGAWEMDGERFHLKYHFSDSPKFGADEDDLRVFLALSSLELPSFVKQIHPENQLDLFGSDSLTVASDDIDFWAFKFQGFDNGFVRNNPDDVSHFEKKIYSTAKSINEIIEEIEGFLGK